MADELPSEYDVIVIGTGMTESIVAAACSRIGKKVLHLDSDDYYGGMWASFNLENLIKKIEEGKSAAEKPRIGAFNFSDRWYLQEVVKPMVEDPTLLLPSSSKEVTEQTKNEMDFSGEGKTESQSVTENANETTSPEEKKEVKVESKEIKWTRESLLKEYRRFNIDLAPKLLFARGDLVELLISSNIARYSEFRCVNRVLTWYNETLHPVPCSRADVFATKYVSVVEKRMLMKILTSLMEFEESKAAEYYDKESVTFLEFLRKKKLPDNIVRYLLYAIAGASDSTLCKDGILRCKKFLTSLGRYGNTPFLWSMYGCGELPQGFCRLCAVYGGIYYLNRPIDEIKVDESPTAEKCVIVRSNDKELKCDHLVMAIHKAPEKFSSNLKLTNGISRAIFITNASILPFEKESLTLLQFPPLPGKKNPVIMIELGPSTCSVPNGLYMLHMTCKQHEDAEADLKDYAAKLLHFDESYEIESKSDSTHCVGNAKPMVLWSVYFNVTDTSEECFDESQSTRIHLCSGPDTELDFDKSIRQAEEIFRSIYSDAEFLPRAPDPEEIVFDDQESNPGPIFEKDVVASDLKEHSEAMETIETGEECTETIRTEQVSN